MGSSFRPCLRKPGVWQENVTDLNLHVWAQIMVCWADAAMIQTRGAELLPHPVQRSVCCTGQ